jgi:uncharacterized OsmC-like protein
MFRSGSRLPEQEAIMVTPRELALKELHERKARALARRPAIARACGQAHVRLDDAGFGCRVEDADRALLADLAAEDGGDGSAPSPDQLMRAALGAALALGYRVWGARLEVPIGAIEVDVISDADARGPLGVEAIAVGWQRLRIDVRIISAAPEADVRRVVETADRLSPHLANLAPAIARIHHLTIEGR